MFQGVKQQLVAETQEYASKSLFCQIFKDEMKQLYLLAFLMTADHGKAEQCFVAGLEDSISGNPVFKQWAHSWSRRAVIKNGIRMMAPGSRLSRHPAERWIKDSSSESELAIYAVAHLPVFERFVFVMCVLEKYSEHECAVLLGSTKKDVIQAKSNALQTLGVARSAALGGLDYRLFPGDARMEDRRDSAA